jgi:hypothetical protein
MILGNYDRIYEIASSFPQALPAADATLAGLAQPTPCPVSPESGAMINSRLPRITAFLSPIPDFDPATLTMRVSGFGQVPASFDPATKQLTWQVTRRLRQPVCQVAVDWLDSAGNKPANPLHWTFRIDRAAAYLPESADPPKKGPTPSEGAPPSAPHTTAATPAP